MLRERRRHANYKPNRRLDRKSSRGMIYENEELRLRTININAEVERGQSDIRKLRRENEQLRREIWSLRDEYDRLNKLLRTNKNSDSCENVGNNSGTQSEDSDSCDTCKEDEIRHDDDDYEDDDDDIDDINNDESNSLIINNSEQEDKKTNKLTKSNTTNLIHNSNNKEIVENFENSQKTILEQQEQILLQNNNDTNNLLKNTETLNTNKVRDNLHVNFDHLSIVSEENLSEIGNNSVHNNDMDSRHQSPSIVTNLLNATTTTTTTIPPLSHFENIQYEQLGTTMMTTTSSNLLDDLNYSTTSTTTTGDTVIPGKDWDFNNQMEFSKSPSNIIPSTSKSYSNEQELKQQSSNCTTNFKSPKHFFSPIKPRLRIDTVFSDDVEQQQQQQQQSSPIQNILIDEQQQQKYLLENNPPDLYVTNALASPSSYHKQFKQQQQERSIGKPIIMKLDEPLYATIHKNYPSTSQRTCSSSSFQTGGNLEDLLMDIETLSKDILQMQLQKSYSQEKLNSTFSDSNLSLNRKPYRSEMNLVLTYNGSNPIITPITKTTSATSTNGLGLNNKLFTNYNTNINNSNYNNNNQDTPPPHLPEPMILFPQNLTYLGFENYGQLTSPPVLVPATPPTPPPPPPPPPPLLPASLSSGHSIPLSLPLLKSHSLQYLHGSSSSINQQYLKQQQNLEGDGGGDEYPIVRVPTPIVCDLSPIQQQQPSLSTFSAENQLSPIHGTNLITHRSPAVIRRKLFSKTSSESPQATTIDGGPTSSFDGKLTKLKDGKFTRTTESSTTSENANCDSSSGSEATKRKPSRRVSILFNGRKSSEEKLERDKEKERDRKTEENTKTNKNLTDLEYLNNEQLTIKTSTSLQSTPLNSPHSSGRHTHQHSGGGGGGSGGGRHHHHHHHHHQSGRQMSQDSIKLSKNTSGGQMRKCSRRHSEGTVLTGGGLGAGGSLLKSGTTGSSSAICSSTINTQHSGDADGLHDSYHEHQGTSISERNSNSLASSRESSTSLRSQRRKISISSHTGGKIPWCGCWGNGCL